jgi:ferredoxin
MAGGIGITPFMAMMDQMEREGRIFELHYAVRTRTHGAYWKDLAERYGNARVKIYCDAETLFIPVDSILASQPLGAHLYVCGPAGMIKGVLGKATQFGWPQQNLHFEEFLAPPHGKPFRAILRKSAKTVEVRPHQSILEAAEAVGVDAPYLCRGGACGQCETSVLGCDGHLEHNDHYLPPEEKAEGKKIMICVSRISGSEIALDL